MEYFTSNDGYQLAYQTAGSKSLPPLILVSTPNGHHNSRACNVWLYHKHIVQMPEPHC